MARYGFDPGTTIIGSFPDLLYRMDDGRVSKRFVMQSNDEADELDERHRKKQPKLPGTHLR